MDFLQERDGEDDDEWEEKTKDNLEKFDKKVRDTYFPFISPPPKKKETSFHLKFRSGGNK